MMIALVWMLPAAWRRVFVLLFRESVDSLIPDDVFSRDNPANAPTYKAGEKKKSTFKALFIYFFFLWFL